MELKHSIQIRLPWELASRDLRLQWEWTWCNEPWPRWEVCSSQLYLYRYFQWIPESKLQFMYIISYYIKLFLKLKVYTLKSFRTSDHRHESLESVNKISSPLYIKCLLSRITSKQKTTIKNLLLVKTQLTTLLGVLGAYLIAAEGWKHTRRKPTRDETNPG